MVKLIILLRTGNYLIDAGADYNSFLMALDGLPGLQRKAVSTIYRAVGEAIPYQTVIEVGFASRDALDAALSSPKGVEAGNLLLKFAGRDAITLFADTLEESYELSDSDGSED